MRPLARERRRTIGRELDEARTGLLQRLFSGLQSIDVGFGRIHEGGLVADASAVVEQQLCGGGGAERRVEDNGAGLRSEREKVGQSG